MLIFIVFLIGAFLLSPMWKNEKCKNLYLLIIGVALIFITSYRSYTFYTDTQIYYKYYLANAEEDLRLLFFNIFNEDVKDPFYHFLGALFSSWGITFRGWLVFVSIVYYSGFIYVLKRFSKLPFISIFGLIALSYVFFTMTGIRQTLAMGFTFFAFVKAYDKKFIPFLLFTLLGYLFHSSALIFILAYFLMHRRIGFLQIALIVGAMVIALAFPSAINNIVRELAWNEDLAMYADTTTGLSLFGYLVQLMIAGGSMFIANRYCFNDKEGIALMNMIILGLVFQTFVIRIDNIFRLSMYFSVYGMILVGNALTKQKGEGFVLGYFIVCIAFLAYMLYSQNYVYFTMFGTI